MAFFREIPPNVDAVGGRTARGFASRKRGRSRARSGTRWAALPPLGPSFLDFQRVARKAPKAEAPAIPNLTQDKRRAPVFKGRLRKFRAFSGG
jgi:hypothetical protein